MVFCGSKKDGCAKRKQRTRLWEQSDRDLEFPLARTHGPGHGDLRDAGF